MAKKDLIDLVKMALPEDVPPEELFALAPAALWQEKPDVAVESALRKHPRLSWEAYKHRSADLRDSEIDPCLHFLQHGIYEGRKLVSWHPLKELDKAEAPLVSILIANYNNALYLDKCLESARLQSLKDIEIVAVDDGSSDESQEIIKCHAQADGRIRAFFHKTNKGTLLARKTGIRAAAGRYVTFLDSDDRLAPGACQTALNKIRMGYDIVRFGGSPLSIENASADSQYWGGNLLNAGEDGEYYGMEIFSAIFLERKIGWNLAANLILREIALAAFEEIGDGYFVDPEDAFCSLAVSFHARSMLKIKDRLYIYNIGQGGSTTSSPQRIHRNLSNYCDTSSAILKYLRKKSSIHKFAPLKNNLCKDVLVKWIKTSTEAGVAENFRKICDTFGVFTVLQELITHHSHEGEKIANCLPAAREDGQNREIHSIGILYPYLGPGGIERTIKKFCEILIQAGYNVAIFTEISTNYDVELPPEVRIQRLNCHRPDVKSQLARLASLEKAIRESGVDVVLHMATLMPYIVWDLTLLHHLGIPVIFGHHYNFAFSFLKGFAASHRVSGAVFRAAEAVICLSLAEELYLREHGVNATYLPRPISSMYMPEREDIPPVIAVMGRLGDPIKQAGEALKVLQEVIAKAPWVSMILIGDFYTPEQREQYRKKVRELKLERNIRLTDWTREPEKILAQCGVLLSTSAWEGFGLAIAEAQGLGLPCVIYDLAIEQVKDNPSIISVPQGNYKDAAKEILGVLEDSERYRELSAIAAGKAKAYDKEKVGEALLDFLSNFTRQSPLRDYGKVEYETIIKYSSHYSGREMSTGL